MARQRKRCSSIQPHDDARQHLLNLTKRPKGGTNLYYSSFITVSVYYSRMHKLEQYRKGISESNGSYVIDFNLPNFINFLLLIHLL